MAGDSSRKKGGLRKKQSPSSSNAQPQIGQAIKERETKKWSRTDGRLCRPTRQTHEQQVDFGHTWKRGTRKAQTPLAYTQPIQDMVRSWVRGKGVWFGGGERGKPILGFLLGLFWGKCSVGMTYHQTGKAELEPLGACHEG